MFQSSTLKVIFFMRSRFLLPLREGWKRHPFAKHRQGQPGAKDTADSPARGCKKTRRGTSRSFYSNQGTRPKTKNRLLSRKRFFNLVSFCKNLSTGKQVDKLL